VSADAALDAVSEVMGRSGGWPALVLELQDATVDGVSLLARAIPVDWLDELPDVIVLESRVDVDVHTLDDGRIVHVYRTTDPESGA
jgi:hypothetical protein